MLQDTLACHDRIHGLGLDLGAAIVDQIAGVAQQGDNPPIAVAAIAAGQLDHIRDQAIFVVTAVRDTALGRAVRPSHPTGAALRDPEPATDMVDALVTTRGARKFPGPPP